MGRYAYRTTQVFRSSAARQRRRAVAQAAGGLGMSLVMVLEMESGATVEDVASTLSGLNPVLQGKRIIEGGLLSGSRCGYGFQVHRDSVPVRARGMRVPWRVGLTMTFHFRAAYMLDSLGQIYQLIELFADQHPHRFVLSFQYERIYAVRDECGLNLVWKIS